MRGSRSRLLLNGPFAAPVLIAMFGSGPVHAQYGGTDVNLITGAEFSPWVTQDTSSVWVHGNTVVVAFVDSSGGSLSPQSFTGASVSTDGGRAFTRLPERFNGSGANLGDATVLFSRRAGRWHLTSLSARCGQSGIAQWISYDGFTWFEGACLASSNNADSPSTWVDNNPNSPFYGRLYVLYNDLSQPGSPLRFTFSTNDGATWTPPATISTVFRRAVKVTGSLGADGTVFLQTLDDGSGGLNGMRQNIVYRSRDGGATWDAPVSQGAPFLVPGRSESSGRAGIYTAPVAGYWRVYGTGQPGVGPNGVVHYVYAARSTTTPDPGDILYTRSADNGSTWSVPLRMNTDATMRAQWNPSLCVNVQGTVFVSWYDERATTGDALERYGRVSKDNGLTWQADLPLGDVAFPKPLQPDPNISDTFVGLFDHAAFSDDGYGSTACVAWTDGRVAVGGSPQQDVFFDRVDFGAPASLLAAGSVAVVSAGPNGVVDPGETVTLTLGARNVGDAGRCTSETLTGTLLASGGVISPTPATRLYGAMCAGDPEAARSFTFTASPTLPCGSPITASLVMRDGVTEYGTLVFRLPTGSQRLQLSEDFDGVVPPALPAGWTAASLAGTSPPWQTSSSDPDTPPNAVSIDAPATVSDRILLMPAFTVRSPLAQLRFRNRYATEAGFDGGVLEISSPIVNGGAFTDIAAPETGASFASGGYSDAIRANSSSPIAGRRAWTGVTAGAIDTVVNLGGRLAGWPIRLRFRMATDAGTAGTGWTIDSMAVTEPACRPTWLVTTADDHDDGACTTGDCTLREAILAAGAGDVIAFSPGIGSVIALRSPLPVMNRSITLQGPGADRLSVRRDSGGPYRVFRIGPGAGVAIRGLTIANGDAAGDYGGGIYNDHGALTLADCLVTANTAVGGGGIASDGSGAGAAYALVTGTTFTGNAAAGGFSAAGALLNLAVDGGTAIAEITNSTLAGNTAVIDGGAIANSGASGSAKLSVLSCTFSGNNVANDGGEVTIGNSLFGAGSGSDSLADYGGAVTSLGHNLSADGGGGKLVGPGDRPNTDPRLDPAGPAANGGPTPTIALLAGSPAIDAGDDRLAPPDDQRGFRRSGVSDIGAFEFGGLSSIPYTMADVLRAARVSGGLAAAAAGDEARLDVEPGSPGITLRDAVRLARKAAGLEPNP